MHSYGSVSLSSVIRLRDQSGMYLSVRMGSGLLENDPLSLGWCLSTLLRKVIPSSVCSTPEDEFYRQTEHPNANITICRDVTPCCFVGGY